VPGVGPLVVAGSLTSALLGGVESSVGGAAAGGVLGWRWASRRSKSSSMKII